MDVLVLFDNEQPGSFFCTLESFGQPVESAIVQNCRMDEMISLRTNTRTAVSRSATRTPRPSRPEEGEAAGCSQADHERLRLHEEVEQLILLFQRQRPQLRVG